ILLSCLSILRLSCIFFFSSRRRHTRSKRDWSSDVCSSDLFDESLVGARGWEIDFFDSYFRTEFFNDSSIKRLGLDSGHLASPIRSEERRVGKECRSREEPTR